MTSGIQLVLLRCPTCSNNMSGAAESVFLYCNGCGAGFEITPEDEWKPVKVYFARTHKEAKTFFSFWAYDARLDLKQRETKKSFWGGDSKGLIEAFEQRGTIRFYVSAYLADVGLKESHALQLTFQQPELEYLQRQSQLPGVAVTDQDARKLADDLFLTSEIEQKDMLRSLSY